MSGFYTDTVIAIMPTYCGVCGTRLVGLAPPAPPDFEATMRCPKCQQSYTFKALTLPATRVVESGTSPRELLDIAEDGDYAAERSRGEIHEPDPAESN
jgi:hypothetical protein